MWLRSKREAYIYRTSAGISIRYFWNVLRRFTWRHIAMLSAEVTFLGYRLFSFSEYDATRSHEAMEPAMALDLWARTDFRPKDLACVSRPEKYILEKTLLENEYGQVVHYVCSLFQFVRSYLPVRYPNFTRWRNDKLSDKNVFMHFYILCNAILKGHDYFIWILSTKKVDVYDLLPRRLSWWH